MLFHLLDRLDQYKIMILMTIRPDYSSPLVDHPNVIRLTIGRLGTEHAKKMISAVGGETKLPLEVVEHILIKTDGVPLFIETALLMKEAITVCMPMPAIWLIQGCAAGGQTVRLDSAPQSAATRR